MSRGRLVSAMVLAVALLAAWPAPAVEPDEVLGDPVLEARARDLSQSLRCLVCQNQSIDDSNADLARTLRILVRERLVAGDSDGEAINYIVARYGDFVLLKPPMKPATYALWFGPAVIFALAVGAIALYFHRRRRAAPAEAPPLSAEERKRLKALLEGDSGSARR